MQPTWLKLLEYNYQRRFGLTFPFLIGALRTPPGLVVAGTSNNFAELEALLESMRDDAPESRYIRIVECDRLHQPVAAPGFRPLRPSAVDRAIPSARHDSCCLYVQPKYLPDEMRGVTALAESLWRESTLAILAGRFSFRGGAFHPFDDNDLRFIEDALASVSEDDA